MSKALTVLAACIDIRSGKRFAPGETFDPVPAPEQAKRLFKAGCLPEAAIVAADAAEADAEKAAEQKDADDKAAREKAEAEAKAKTEAAAKKAAEQKA